ncbi:MAG TPA: helix-turn-helix domain-containing protein [Planctomycetota bacterium]|nr:helix-turn-helix domain-containing protein [Planctomycetota bacterium]
METIRRARKRRRMSQRELSRRAGVSFRGIQLLEAPGHDARLSTLEKVADALGLPAAGVRWLLDRYLDEAPESAFCASVRILVDGFDSWKIHLFDFVDRFRADPAPALVLTPPASGLDPRLAALLASVVDTLCVEQGRDPPGWSAGVGPLPRPWFVSGVESLKASALLESPARFRRRNVFVLSNFLSRA